MGNNLLTNTTQYTVYLLQLYGQKPVKGIVPVVTPSDILTKSRNLTNKVMNKFPLETPSVDIVLKNTKVLSDNLRDHKVVYLYYNNMKVGRMEFGIVTTPLQGGQYVLRNYNVTPEYSELFKGEESPIVTLTNYVKTLLI